MIVFIGCTRKKKETICKARDMYSLNDLFNKRLKYAKTLTDESKIFILSAKYGLLSLDDVIEPYNCKLKSKTSLYTLQEWNEKVLEGLRKKNIDFNEEIYIAASGYYVKVLIENFKNFQLERDLVLKENGGCTWGYILNYYKKLLQEEK